MLDDSLLKVLGGKVPWANVLPIAANTASSFLQIPEIAAAYDTFIVKSGHDMDKVQPIFLSQHPQILELCTLMSKFYSPNSNENLQFVEDPQSVEDPHLVIDGSTQTDDLVSDDLVSDPKLKLTIGTQTEDDLRLPGSDSDSGTQFKLGIVGIKNGSNMCFLTCALWFMLRFEVIILFIYLSSNLLTNYLL